MGSVGLANKGSCCRADVWGEEEENQQALASLHETMKWWASERDEAVAASNFGALVLQAVYGKCVGNAVCQLGWMCLVLRPSPGCSLTGPRVQRDVVAVALLLSHGFWFHCFISVYHFIWLRAAFQSLEWNLHVIPVWLPFDYVSLLSRGFRQRRARMIS